MSFENDSVVPITTAISDLAGQSEVQNVAKRGDVRGLKTHNVAGISESCAQVATVLR